MAEATEGDVELESSGETLKNILLDKLKDLDLQLEDIGNRQFEIFNQLNKPKNDISSKAKTIGFVKEIERANQFFDFMDYLKEFEGLIKHDTDCRDIFKRLLKEERVQDSYVKLDYQDIMNAIQDRQMYLSVEQHHKFKQGKGNDTSLNSEVLALEERTGDRLMNPIIDLVYRIRNRGYVMHEDPLVELDRKMEDRPIYHTIAFRKRLIQKYLEKKVIICNISIEYDADNVKAILRACGGDIEDFKMTHVRGSWSSVAHVTFSSAEGAKLAPFLCEEDLFSFFPVLELPVRESESSKEFIKKYKEAMSKYNKFRNLSKDVKSSRKEMKKMVYKAAEGVC